MIIDCHVHVGKLGEHYPQWWVADRLGLEPIAPEDLDKILWKNTARLWRIEV